MPTRKRPSADSRALAAERAKREADQARLEAERAKADSDAAAERAMRQRAEAEAASAVEVERSRVAVAQAEREKAELREQLRNHSTPFLRLARPPAADLQYVRRPVRQPGKYTLKPGAKEKLAKIAGIVLGHPGLKLEVEGHTRQYGRAKK